LPHREADVPQRQALGLGQYNAVLAKALEVGEQPAVNEVAQVVAGQRLVVVDLPGGYDAWSRSAQPPRV